MREEMIGITVLSSLIGLAIAIFWMRVGCRAMRAHEQIAEALQRMARGPGEDFRP